MPDFIFTDDITVIRDTEREVHVLESEDVEVHVLTVADQGPPGPQGPAGPAGGASIEFPFAWGDATPATVVTAGAGKLVYGVQVHISEAFNGAGAQILVGDAGDNDRLMAAGQNDPSAVGAYTAAPEHRYGSATAVNITVVPGSGATAGRGLLTLTIET